MTTATTNPMPTAVEAAPPHVELMEITPSMAERWLDEANTHNRRMNKGKIDRYARDMLKGHWQTTPQGIVFSTDGTLIDGQNRLAAIIRANLPVTMYVWFDVDMATQRCFDQHEPRGINVALTLDGKLGEVTQKDVAALRAMIAGLNVRRKITVDETAELLATHRKAIQFAMDNAQGIVRGIFSATVRAVIARAYYSADRAKLERFCELLKGPGGANDDEQAVQTLFTYLIKTIIRRGAQLKERYAKTERALAAFLKGETLTSLFPTKRELFPLPEETEKEEFTAEDAENAEEKVEVVK